MDQEPDFPPTKISQRFFHIRFLYLNVYTNLRQINNFNVHNQNIIWEQIMTIFEHGLLKTKNNKDNI